MSKTFDAIIIGAGVIGCATAVSLLKRKKVRSLLVLEKEARPAVHTSGRNSGVIHSGFNLKPGSKKARFCVEGNARLRAYCEKNKIPYQMTGTLVVAQNVKEIPVLEELERRGKENNVPDIQIIDEKELKKKEPHAIGVAALFSPTGGITNGRLVTERLAEEAKELGATFAFFNKATTLKETGTSFAIKAAGETYVAPYIYNCGGLYADEIAHKLGVGENYTIVPFRGEYYYINPKRNNILNSMIYPAPDLAYPFLGVHWTKTIDGAVKVGPNATLAWGRESYHPLKPHVRELSRMLTKKHFWKLWGSKEFRRLAVQQLQVSLSRKRFINEAKKLIPDVEPHEFKKGVGGNRAQMIDQNGALVDDMVVEKKGNSIHVLNAVSPGLTCSLPFADFLCTELFNAGR